MQPFMLDSLLEDAQMLLAKQASAGKGDLPAQLRRADRLLTREARRAGQLLVEAQALAANPKTVMRIDERAVRRAHKRLIAHLKTLDPWDRRKGQILGFLGAVSGGILLIFGLAVLVMYWRGLI